MARDRFITPANDAPTAQICRRVFIPDDEEYLALFFGALTELTKEYNWQQVNGITPAAAAAAFRALFDDASQSTRRFCRVVGEIICFAGTATPDPDWLVCDGSSLLRADYPDLFGQIGTTYGAVDSDHFSIPDLRGRAGVGSGQGSGLTDRDIGDVFGAETHTLVEAEMPTHTHPDPGHYHQHYAPYLSTASAAPGVPIPTSYVGLANTWLAYTGILASGGDDAHNNMQPSLVLSYWIVAK